MKKLTSLFAAAFVFALAACSPPAAKDAETHDSVAHDTAATPAAPAVQAKGTGEIVVLQPEYGAVTIRHEAIPEYNMGAMTMEFTTADPSQLNGLKVGDRVEFDLKAATEIEKITVVKGE